MIGPTIINSNLAMPFQAARQKAKAIIIFQTIEDSSALQDILTASTTDNQKKFFISQLLITLPNAFSDRTRTPSKSTSNMAPNKSSASKDSPMDDKPHDWIPEGYVIAFDPDNWEYIVPQFMVPAICIRCMEVTNIKKFECLWCSWRGEFPTILYCPSS